MRQNLSASLSTFPRPYQCTFADPCHLCNLTICFPLFQKIQSQLDLLRGELLRSAVFEVRILLCHCLSCLGSLYDHSPFIFSKGKHNSQNQITCQCVFNKSHVQNMNSDTSFKQLSYNLHALNKGKHPIFSARFTAYLPNKWGVILFVFRYFQVYFVNLRYRKVRIKPTIAIAKAITNAP